MRLEFYTPDELRQFRRNYRSSNGPAPGGHFLLVTLELEQFRRDYRSSSGLAPGRYFLLVTLRG